MVNESTAPTACPGWTRSHATWTTAYPLRSRLKADTHVRLRLPYPQNPQLLGPEVGGAFASLWTLQFSTDWCYAMRIFDYALVADWEDRLDTLADMAEPERWTYMSVPAPHGIRLPVLDSYMKFTFLRLFDQGKIAEVDDVACFNTGLLTPGQEEIFGVFSVSENFDSSRPVAHDNRKWFLKTWARSGDRILTSFASLPSLASYWDDPGELIFDPSLRVQPNVDHILRDNLNRFPEALGGRVDERGVPLDRTELPPIDEDEPEVDQMEEEGNFEPTGFSHLARIALEGSIEHSLRMARRSYRVAVPQFHKGRIQLLLPLHLRDTSKVDLALTLERYGDWYRAATVLYPDWAYRHARLLSRPNSEWLGGFRADAVN